MKPVSSKTPVLRKPKGPENKWTPEEDDVLAAAVAASGFKVCWRKIALSLPGRTNKSCRKRWIHSLDPSLKKGRWTAQEDKILLNAIKIHGTLWYKVAKHLPGRTDDQAAKRFREKLDPSIARTPWSEEEDEVLIKMWRQVGKRWNLISKELKGRPAVHCRNRWQSLFRVGKVDSTGMDPDFAVEDGDDGKGDEDDEVFLSPTEPTYMPRPSTGSSSSSSSSPSPLLSTPVHTSRALAPSSMDSVFMYSPTRKDHDSRHLRLPSLSITRPSEFCDVVDNVLAHDSSRRSVDSFSLRISKSRIEDHSFPNNDPRSNRPQLFMMPHPNMRIIPGNHEQHVQHHQNTPIIAPPRRKSQQYALQHQEQQQFHFNLGHPPPAQPSSPYFIPPPYDPQQSNQSSMFTPNQNFLPSPPQNPSFTAPVPAPPSGPNNTNNFLMTCPLVHCGFQSANLIDLWKHVTWDHVNPAAANGSVPTRLGGFDLEEFEGVKLDPGMMDFMERAVLDLEAGGNGNAGGFGGYGLEELDAAAAALGVCHPGAGRTAHVSSA